MRTPGKEISQKERGVANMFKIVEHEQNVFVMKVVAHLLFEGAIYLLAQAKFLRNGARDKRRIMDGRQIHEGCPITKQFRDLMPNLQGKSCLPNSARTGERDQTPLREQLPHGRHLPFPPDEAGERMRQIVADSAAFSR